MKGVTYQIIKPEMAVEIGEGEAILLERIVAYISGNSHNITGKKGKWIYNSVRQWQEDHFPYWSRYKIKKVIKSLEDKNLIISYKVNAKKCNHTKWYSVNFKEYKKLIEKVYNKDVLNEQKSSRKKSTNRLVENEPIYNITNSYYTEDTKVSSSNKDKKIKNNNLKKDVVYKTTMNMKDIWNQIFKYSANPIKAYVSEKNINKLNNLLENKFDGDIEKWKEYAIKVNSSKFLMGEKETKKGFKAVFGWLIKEEVVEAIKEGEYGVGDRELDKNDILGNIEKKREAIVNMVDKKISSYAKSKINKEKEMRELEAYAEEAQNIGEEDKYGILRTIKGIPKYMLFKDKEYRGVRENIYESYVMKKHFGNTKIEIRKKIRDKLGEMGLNINLEEEFNRLVMMDERVGKIDISNQGDLEKINDMNYLGRNLDFKSMKEDCIIGK